mmetsp:Transcript_140194/g.447379  ORF Transcript_140194/g.447379 Transcript_140194/m.447379 type:complete len:117 (+) Transcript_140194:642-992(+)
MACRRQQPQPRHPAEVPAAAGAASSGVARASATWRRQVGALSGRRRKKLPKKRGLSPSRSTSSSSGISSMSSNSGTGDHPQEEAQSAHLEKTASRETSRDLGSRVPGGAEVPGQFR